MVTVNSLTLIGSFASSLVLQIFDHNKQRIEYLPNSVSTHVNCIYLIASLKRNVGCNWNPQWNNRQKCVGRILFFTSFSFISSDPSPIKTAKQSRYFCVFKYAAGTVKKKRSRARLNTEGETGEKRLNYAKPISRKTNPTCLPVYAQCWTKLKYLCA